MQRRHFLAASAGLMATSALGLPMAATAQSLTRIRLVQSTYGFLYVPAMVAQEAGFFAANGLEAEFIVNLGGTEALAAMLSGDAQIVTEASSSAMRARQSGTNAVIFGGSATRYASNVVISKKLAAEKGITAESTVEERIEALRGSRMAVIGLGSGTHQLLLYLLQRGNMNPDTDLEILGIGQVSGVLASFEQGRIDGFIASSPNSDIAVRDHDGMMLFNMGEGAIPELNDYPYVSYIAREDWIAENPETYEAFCASINAAMAALQDPAQNPGLRDIIHAKYHDQMDKELFDAVWASMTGAWPQDLALSREMAEKALEFLNLVSGETFGPELLDTAFVYR